MREKIIKFLVCVVLFLIAFIIPLFKFNFDVASILTVASLFFAILVGFFIAAATSNYLALQSLIAEEDAGLIAIYNYCHIISPEKSSKLVEVLDKYAIAALSFELTEYVDKTHREFDDVSKVVEEIDFKDARGGQLIQLLYEKKNSLYQTRQNIALVARSIVTRVHWLVLCSLAIIIDILLLAIRDDSFFSCLITGILFIVTFLVLLLLNHVDNNRFLEQAMSYDNSQQIFMVIGKPKYYVEAIIKSGRVLEPKETYRTGYYNGPDDSEIRLVDKTI
ncbi:MAG: hypothetical protein NTU76_01710 [Candidatus Taylorbacteria bacterium]|nr:hypothetical protein [Candidatus Taylorbacteria bacterium]